MTKPPFVIFALPRSRTAWLSEFLTYRDWQCDHEQMRYMRGMDDVKSWLAQEKTGTVETAAASWWRLILHYRPDIRFLTIRRPTYEVVGSLMKQNEEWSLGFDETAIERSVLRADAKLDQIEERTGCPSISFERLRDQIVCADLFKDLLPYSYAAGRGRWDKMNGKNIQCSMSGLAQYIIAHSPQMTRALSIARQVSLALMHRKTPTNIEGMTFQQETFDDWLRDGVDLFKQHSVYVGENAESFLEKNISLMRALNEAGALQILTARSNGRMFGYLVSLISPSLEAENRLSAIHTTFFSSPDAPRLGKRLRQEANDLLLAKGVYDVTLHAGSRGDGPRMAKIYEREGAKSIGSLYRQNLGDL